ncbi:MAG: hypothetical protein AAF135_21330 [Bacteroidota bacterium]
MAQRITEQAKHLPISRTDLWTLMPDVTRNTIYRRYNRMLQKAGKEESRHVELTAAEVARFTGFSLSFILRMLERT